MNKTISAIKTIITKKALFLLMLIATTACGGFSQHNTSTKPVVNIDYVQKSKNQKIAGWILFGGGMILTTAGISKVISDNLLGEPLYETNTGEVLMLVGSASMLASIPLFIACSRNRRKAISLSFKNEYSQQIQKGIVAYKIVPSLSMKIEL